MVWISAHQCGAGKHLSDADTAAALRAVTQIDCEYVEFDVQRTADAVFVLFHDAHVVFEGESHVVAELTLAELRRLVPTVTLYGDALDLLAGAKKAHLDFKFASPALLYEADAESTYEVQATVLAVERLGAEHVIVTTLEDQGVAAVREWARSRHPELLVGLSLGRSRRGLPLQRQVVGRLSELFPGRRIVRCDANLVVANRWLATFGVARWVARRRLPLLVWTVDTRRGLRRWLHDPRAWMVTTNHPRRAAQIRASLR